MATTTNREYQSNPEFDVTLPEDGKVTGTVHVSVVSGDYVYITSNRRVNGSDRKYLTFRGQGFQASHVRAYLWSDGTWHAMKEGGRNSIDANIYRAEGFLVDAPPTYKAMIVAAIIDAVSANVTPMALARAEYARLYNDETGALEDVRRLEAELANAVLVARVAGKRTAEAHRALSALS